MHGLVFDLSLPRYALAKGLGRAFPSLYTGRLSCLSLREVEPPEPPGPGWVKLKNRMAGLCGSDLATIFLKASPQLEPFNSFPAVLGHEILAEVAEVPDGVRGLEVGQRVAVDPFLPCALRGIDPICRACRRGALSACERMAEGCLAPGMLIGFHRDLPGGMGPWSVAHESQLYRLPEHLPDEVGVLVEPLAVAMRAVLQNRPEPDDRILVIGGGPIAFAVLWALRAAGFTNHLTLLTIERYQREAAQAMGADEVMAVQPDREEAEAVAEATGGKTYQPILGPPVVEGGYDLVFDCVGSALSMNDALRYVAAAGRVVLLGASAVLDGIDWTPVWRHEITIRGSMAYGIEEFRGERKHTFAVVCDLLAANEGPDPSRMVTHRFRLSEYRKAIEANVRRGAFESIKTVFDLREEP
ncbi:MAG: alcohol dehydrogenase [Deltaproteobacteria bacterium]|nr:MAG: alcohol dehydrogenase [Deltaproteobacteria bacterium]